MYFLYSLLLSIGFIALLPRFVYDGLRHGKYVAGFRERLGDVPLIETGGRAIVWLHCVSVGETQAARPLARAVLQKYPNHALVVSTTTLTGQSLAREVFRDDAAAVFYFPFDWAWTVRRALRRVNPSAVLVMETELWPRFLRECRRRRVPVAIVNGRLSDKSSRRYKLVRSFIKHIVGDLSLAIMQTEADAARIRALGLAPDRVLISGNVKFDAEAVPDEQVLTGKLRDRFLLDGARPLIVAASTHAPEERVVIEAFKQLLGTSDGLERADETRRVEGPTDVDDKSRAVEQSENARLLIAPRHPERFAETATLVEASGLTWARRSAQPSARDAACDVILLDSIGELRAVYPLASIVFVGGSVSRTGGHNVIEPAAAGACIITGAHTSNFTAIVRAFVEADALVQLPPLSEADAARALAETWRELLAHDERRQAIAKHALNVLESNRGATTRTVEMLASILDQRPPVIFQTPETHAKLTSDV